MSDINGYKFEINHIIDELKDLERGNFYEVDRRPGTPSAKTVAKNVREMFEDMMVRIAEDRPGRVEELFEPKKK